MPNPINHLKPDPKYQRHIDNVVEKWAGKYFQYIDELDKVVTLLSDPTKTHLKATKIQKFAETNLNKIVAIYILLNISVAKKDASNVSETQEDPESPNYSCLLFPPAKHRGWLYSGICERYFTND